MAIVVLIILGVVQGLCEFLPISSSGHLVLLSKIFGVEDSLFVSIILHLATLFAVIIVLRKEILYILKHPLSKESINLVISTIFTCIIAIVLMPFISASFEGKFLPIAFLLSAILLLIAPKFSKGEGEIDYKKAMIIGLAQGFAIFPGLSRSGTTITTSLMAGGKKEECGKFSFLISIPIILASLFFEIIKIFVNGEVISVNPLGLGLAFLISLFIGIFTIKYMLKLTKKANFKFFAAYLIVMSVVSAIVMWI